MSQPGTPKSFSPDDALPPIEPPSAGFLVQLFLIPGLIVTIIVVVWLLFHWLAQMGNDPRQYVKQLRGNSETRWQAAVNLAGALHGEAGSEIKHDASLAAELSQILDDEIRTGSMDEGPINMRIYLCRALGEFQVDTGLPVLIKAAGAQRGDAEIDVRRAAVQGIASLAANMETAGHPLQNSELIPTLIEASKSDNPKLRAETAYALGVIDDPKAVARLQEMLNDAHPDARFNAATALANYGKQEALPILLEMIEPDQSLAMQDERPEARREKQLLVNINGLRAIVRLADMNPTVDLARAQEAIDRLTKSNLPEVRDNALAAKEKLSRTNAVSK
jgi:hypothetical protein